ncbi:hypothetical protein GE061_006451 [Apolygus lucorum]|uniref:Hydrophobin n=1 Tax=Apolygus lucorum TaxID=248454 RepID=A0A8S9WT87_APOLU|nr:hypothetical protein GE061_006451 [Apolygus lucorum]
MGVNFIYVLCFAALGAVTVSTQQVQTSTMSNMNAMNFNLTSLPGILAFLQAEGIDPNSLVVPNCIRNGDQCQSNGGQPCCLSPVFTCQPNRSGGGGNACYVIPMHAPHIPQIQQIISYFGMTTDKPVQ